MSGPSARIWVPSRPAFSFVYSRFALIIRTFTEPAEALSGFPGQSSGTVQYRWAMMTSVETINSRLRRNAKLTANTT